MRPWCRGEGKGPDIQAFTLTGQPQGMGSLFKIETEVAAGQPGRVEQRAVLPALHLYLFRDEIVSLGVFFSMGPASR